MLVVLGLVMVSLASAGSDYYERTSDGVLVNAPCEAVQLMIVGDGTNECTAALYDGSASGTKLSPTWGVSASDKRGGFVIPEATARTSLYVDITTSGTCTVGVYVREK